MKKSISSIFLLLCMPLFGEGLKFDSLLKEAHIPAEENRVSTDFHFVNETKNTITIKKYDAACSCMNATIDGGKMIYEPGEKGTIRTEFDMGNFSGVVDKQVMIYVDEDPDESPSITLTTRVHIPVLVQAEPKTLKWIMGQPAEEKIVTVTMNHDRPIHILRVTGTADGIGHEVREIEEGKKYHVVLKPKDTSVPALGIFRIETDCTIEKHRAQQVFAVIRREDRP